MGSVGGGHGRKRFYGSNMERILLNIRHDEGGCWVWTGTVNRGRGGYGEIRLSKDSRRQAHRLSYEVFLGQIPDGMQVCHRCDNPPCVNPEHLFLGTQKENLADSISKDRFQRGARHYKTKLTADDVREIRRLRDGGMMHADIAERYGLSEEGAAGIARRKRWAHVPEGTVN